MLDVVERQRATPEAYAEMFPGFPSFVHHIMAHVANGKTPEEAAELVGDACNAGLVEATIEQIERTHATFAADGAVEVPESALPRVATQYRIGETILEEGEGEEAEEGEEADSGEAGEGSGDSEDPATPTAPAYANDDQWSEADDEHNREIVDSLLGYLGLGDEAEAEAEGE